MRRTACTLSIGALVAFLLSAPAAHAQARQAFEGALTSDTPATSSGYRLSIDYFDPANPQGKPYAVQQIVQTLHPGTRLDTSVPARCDASDAELMAQGESACPSSTRVGGGTLDADSGAAGGATPRVIQSRVTFFNAANTLILFTESTNAGNPPIRTSGRVLIGERTMTSEVPPVPGTPPPDPFLAIRKVRVSLDEVSAGSRAFIRTPATCPVARRWTTNGRFTYRDGQSQVALSSAACRRPDRWKPRIRALGIPVSCARRPFRARIRIGEHTALRRASVTIDGRLARRTRKKRFALRVNTRRLRTGRHRLTVTAVDLAGNRARRTFRVRRCSGN